MSAPHSSSFPFFPRPVANTLQVQGGEFPCMSCSAPMLWQDLARGLHPEGCPLRAPSAAQHNHQQLLLGHSSQALLYAEEGLAHSRPALCAGHTASVAPSKPPQPQAMGHEVPAAQGSTPGAAPQFMGPKVQPRRGSGCLKKHTAPHMHHHNHLRQQHLVHACRRPQATYRAGLWRVSAHIARSAAVSCYGGCAPAGRGSKQQSPGRHATC